MECSRNQLQESSREGGHFLGHCNSEDRVQYLKTRSSRLVFREGAGRVVQECERMPTLAIHSQCREGCRCVQVQPREGEAGPLGAEGETWEES